MAPLIYLRTENLAKMLVSLTRQLGKQNKLSKTNLVSKNIHKTSSFLWRRTYDRLGVAFEYRDLSFAFRNFFARNLNLFSHHVIATNPANPVNSISIFGMLTPSHLLGQKVKPRRPPMEENFERQFQSSSRSCTLVPVLCTTFTFSFCLVRLWKHSQPWKK